MINSQADCNNQNYSIYFHVPFCTKKCDYCHFYVIPDQQRYKKIYRDALKKEWELRSYLLPNSSPISIYFGGGTPALLDPKTIEEILSWISPPSSCEITLEANPENVSLELMRTLNTCGINRISLGVQTFDDTLLTVLSRTHSSQRSLKAIEECVQAGFTNISIDLMFELPGQNLLSWKKTLDQAVKLPITHLSLYNLTIEPHTVFFKKRNTLSKIDPQLCFEMLTTAVETLENFDFQRYEISAFAKKKMVSKHNIGYWLDRPFLGFGPSAFSYWQGYRFRNISNLNRYAKILNTGLDPTDFKEILTPKEKLKESLALALRLVDGISLKSWPSDIENGLLKLVAEDFLIKKNNNLCLSSKGLLFHDTVAEYIMNF